MAYHSKEKVSVTQTLVSFGETFSRTWQRYPLKKVVNSSLLIVTLFFLLFSYDIDIHTRLYHLRK
jgi:hypothetical protein